MPHRQQINANMNQVLNDETLDPIEPDLVDEYKKLSEKCDIVITKIKTRKQKVKKSS